MKADGNLQFVIHHMEDFRGMKRNKSGMENLNLKQAERKVIFYHSQIKCLRGKELLGRSTSS